MFIRSNIFWGIAIGALCILNLLVLLLAGNTPQPAPIGIAADIALSPPDNTSIRFIDQPGSASPLVRTFLDNQQVIGGYYILKGWAYVANQDTRGQEIFVRIQKPDGSSVHYSTTPETRLDVGAAFKNPLCNQSGFTAAIPLEPGLNLGACSIVLVVKNKDGLYESGKSKPRLRSVPRVKNG
jgi:hypothetical protein